MTTPIYPLDLTGKVVLVTGAASGIGLGIAERFAREGATVALIDRNATQGEAAATKLRDAGGHASFIQADLSQPDAITGMIRAVLERYHRLDIVVNNAATFLPKSVAEISVDEWDYHMAVNLRAPFLVVQAALPALKAAKGTVLNISSTAALRVFSPNLAYSTSKAGLITMTKSLAHELHPFRIRVNCLCPGAVDTPALHTDIAVRGHDPGVLEQLNEQGYLMTTQQIASAALYLVSDEASAITGSIVVVDAGAILS